MVVLIENPSDKLEPTILTTKTSSQQEPSSTNQETIEPHHERVDELQLAQKDVATAIDEKADDERQPSATENPSNNEKPSATPLDMSQPTQPAQNTQPSESVNENSLDGSDPNTSNEAGKIYNTIIMNQ